MTKCMEFGLMSSRAEDPDASNIVRLAKQTSCGALHYARRRGIPLQKVFKHCQYETNLNF